MEKRITKYAVYNFAREGWIIYINGVYYGPSSLATRLEKISDNELFEVTHINLNYLKLTIT